MFEIETSQFEDQDVTTSKEPLQIFSQGASMHFEIKTSQFEDEDVTTSEPYSAAVIAGTRSSATCEKDYSIAAHTGECSTNNPVLAGTIRTKGRYSIAASTGLARAISGDLSIAASSYLKYGTAIAGDYSVAVTTGGDSFSIAGDYGIAVALGKESAGQAGKNGKILLGDYNRHNELIRIVVISVGEEIDGITIEPNHLYLYERGKIKPSWSNLVRRD
jgi:hypothetical protein